MSLVLKIGDREVRLSKNSKVGLTYQCNTLGDLSTRQGNFSNKFKAPKTKENQITLEQSDNINSNSNIPYQRNGATLIQNGIEILPEAIVRVESVDSEYELSVGNGLTTFFQRILGLKLTDLDLSDLDHNYDGATVYAGRLNTEGYIYPYIDWRKTRTAGQENKYNPCVFLKTLVERIILEAGYDLDGNILDNYFYNNTISTCDFRRSKEWVKANQVAIAKNADEYSMVVVGSAGNYVVPMTFQNSGNLFGQIFTAPEPMYVNFKSTIQATFKGQFISGFPYFQSPVEFRYEIINLTTTTMIAQGIRVFTSQERLDIQAGLPIDISVSIESGYQSLGTGNTVQIRQSIITDSFANIAWLVSQQSTYNADVKDVFIPYNGSLVEFSKVQHDTLQSDFMKGVFNMFGIVGQVNEYTKKVVLNTFESISLNIPNAKDWSRKVDVSKTPLIKFSDDGYAKVNYLKWKIESDIIDSYEFNSNTWNATFGSKEPEYYGSGKILIDNENLEEEKTIITIPFFASIRNEVPFANDDYSLDKYGQRMFLLLRYLGDPINPNCIFYDVSRDRTLAFNHFFANKTTLKSEFYSVLEGVLDKYKKITLYLKLNEKDIAELDFTIPIFLDVHEKDIKVNGNFYLNRIENYQQGETTKVELIRL